MSERLKKIYEQINNALFWGTQGLRRQSQDITTYYDPRFASGWEDYVTHMSVGAMGPPTTAIGSSIPMEAGPLTNKKTEEIEDEEKLEKKLAGGVYEQEEPAPAAPDIPAAPGEPAGAPEVPPLGGEEMGGMPGDLGMGGMGMPGMPEETGPETASEVGRRYELKKIYSRLISLDSHLAGSTDENLLKLKFVVSQAIEVFDVLVSNIKLFKDKIDSIIVIYYDFLERVYGILNKYYEKKSKEKENVKVNDKSERISPEHGLQTSQEPVYNRA